MKIRFPRWFALELNPHFIGLLFKIFPLDITIRFCVGFPGFCMLRVFVMDYDPEIPYVTIIEIGILFFSFHLGFIGFTDLVKYFNKGESL